VFEIDPASGKIRCKECFEADPFKTDWISRAAAKRHTVDSNDHATNVQTNVGRRAADAARVTRISTAYLSLHQNHLNFSFASPAPSTQPAMFHENAPDPIHSDDHFFSPMDDIIIPAGITPIFDNTSLEHECLRREVELLMMEAEQIDELGPDYRDDDATLTNIDDNLDPFRVFDQEAEEDGQQDHFTETLASGDFSPYPNKIVCQIVIVPSCELQYLMLTI
jgi:hypothetical protein